MPNFSQISALADRITGAHAGNGTPLIVVLEQDMAKALGHALQLRLRKETPVICIDGIHAPEGSYLDLAMPVGAGTALPVVVKTLAFI